MPTAVFALLLALQVPFPRSTPGLNESRGIDQSFITGAVKRKGAGEPVALATVTVRIQGDASRADQRPTNLAWSGTNTPVRKDGSFRVAVPGQGTYTVCATLPDAPEQCRTLEVGQNDTGVVVFTF